jgi:hypothetical protein
MLKEDGKKGEVAVFVRPFGNTTLSERTDKQ